MSTTVYVVVVEAGEYSDRENWIGGVFTERRVAEQTINDRAAMSRHFHNEYTLWFERRLGICYRDHRHRSPWQLTDDQSSALEAEAGPPPLAEELGDRFYIVAVPLNEWGEFRDQPISASMSIG